MHAHPEDDSDDESSGGDIPVSGMVMHGAEMTSTYLRNDAPAYIDAICRLGIKRWSCVVAA